MKTAPTLSAPRVTTRPAPADNETTLPPKLKASKVCELLGCSHSKLHHLREAGKLSPFFEMVGPKGGSSYLYRRDVVLELERKTRRG